MSTHIDAKGKYFTEVVSKDSIPVVIQTTAQRIIGVLYVRSGERLKDELNRPEQFLAVTDAHVYDSAGDLIYQSEFLALNRDCLVWVIPRTELLTGEETIEGIE